MGQLRNLGKKKEQSKSNTHRKKKNSQETM